MKPNGAALGEVPLLESRLQRPVGALEEQSAHHDTDNALLELAAVSVREATRWHETAGVLEADDARPGRGCGRRRAGSQALQISR